VNEFNDFRPNQTGILCSFIGVGIVKTIIVLISFSMGRRFDLETARTIVFTALPLQEFAVLGMLRYLERAPLLCNRWLVVAAAVSLCVQLLLIYTPVGVLFGVVPLGLFPWLILIGGLAVGYVAALWISDFVVRRLGSILGPR